MFVNYNKRDRTILAAACLLVLIALYFLYDDSLLLRFDDNSGTPEIGKISKIQNDVRNKYAKRFAWKSARDSESVRLGDSIFTGKDSNAIVEFNDGRSLTIQPNSMVIISTTGDQMKLDLKFGSFGGNLDGCIKVDVQGKQVDVCGNKSNLEIDAQGEVKVKSGSVKVANKQIVVAEKELIPWTNLPESEIIHSENNKALKLSWSPKKVYSRYRIQFSKDGKFKNSLTQDITQETSFQTKNYPRRGTYFVRVQAEDQSGQAAAATEAFKIKFTELIAPKILSPLANQKFEIGTNADGELLSEPSIQVSWEYPLSNVDYQLELSDQDDFSKLIFQADTKEKHLKTPSLDSGTYFARVREKSSDHPWSKVIVFEMKSLGQKTLKAPELLTKKLNYIAPSPQQPVAKWKPETQAEKYIIETSPTEDFLPEKTSSFEVKSTNTSLKITKPGATYFRVSAVSKRGTRGPSSETGLLNARIDRPILNPVAPYVTLGKTPEDQGAPIDLKVGWSDLKVADSYQIELSENSNFKNPIKYQSTSAETKISIPKPGEYHWRVRGMNSQGKPITHYSKPDKIKYDLKVPLAQPKLTEPSANMTLFFQKKARPYIWLEWKSVRQASSYSIQVAKDPEFTKMVYQTSASSTRHLIKENLGNGKLYWRTQAVGDDGRISHWSEAREMSIFTGGPSDRLPAGGRK